MTQKIEDLFIKSKKYITFAPLKHPQLLLKQELLIGFPIQQHPIQILYTNR